MSLLYVDDDKSTIGINANRFYVKYADGFQTFIPAETIDSITITGRAQVSTQCIQECLIRVIKVKIRNQSMVLRRYEKSRNINNSENIQIIKRCRDKIDLCTSIEEVME